MCLNREKAKKQPAADNDKKNGAKAVPSKRKKPADDDDAASTTSNSKKAIASYKFVDSGDEYDQQIRVNPEIAKKCLDELKKLRQSVGFTFVIRFSCQFLLFICCNLCSLRHRKASKPDPFLPTRN